MKDPYEVLGLDRTASMDQVKAAYKELVKKYHPDKYQNNPLASLAEEKLQEINEAYDAICKGKAGTYNAGGSYQSGSYSSSSSAEMQNIRSMINMGNLMGAQQALNNASVRDAEWNFLSGIVAMRYGRRDEALTKIQTAVSMDPSNMEYRQALNTLMAPGGQYRQASYGQGYGSGDDGLCKLCAAFTCFDCMCPCI